MANQSGRVIQGSFIGGTPRLACAPPPAIPATSRGATTSPMVARAVQTRSIATHATVAQGAGDGEAFRLPPTLANLASVGGQPLPALVRQKMESFFNTGFADVRVHVGTHASSIGALAFTHGSNLYFAPGQYDPTNAQGLRLLGHELTHVVQQRAGRVRNPFGSGIAVVQDRMLEAEADRLGAKAVMHVGEVSPGTVSACNRLTQAGAAGIQRSPSGSKSIQRTIHQWNGGRWEIKQIGTAGRFQKPDTGKPGEYFNDVNGKRGDTIDAVRAGLSDLMMITGSLKNVDAAWPPKLWNALMAMGDGVNYLGKVTLTATSAKAFPIYAGEQDLVDQLWADFVRPFMIANGQLPYIERQDWFIKHRAEVDIDLNFYKNRGYGAELSFHKDTAGDNLFVNLMFNNKTATPGTEWIEDLATPLRTKRLEMRRLMPKGMRAEIRAARKNIREDVHQPAGKKTIRGGIAPEAAFVSWVDELIWHATPSTERRHKVSGGMFEALAKPERYWIDEKTHIHRALRYLSTFPDTLIGKWDVLRKSRREWGFGTDFVDSYMKSVVLENGANGPNYAEHFRDIKRHQAELEQASISLGIGQELAPDPTGVGTAEFNQRTRIHRSTPRQNSSRDLRAGLREARKQNEIRSFLRTWVRVRKVQ